MKARNLIPAMSLALQLVLWTDPLRLAAQTLHPLSLEEAIAIARQNHPSLQAARAKEDMASAELAQSRASRLPTISVGEDATVSSDPVFAFGSKLRQGRFAQSDFTLDSLNHPSPVANFSGSGTASWTALDLTSRHRIAAASATVKAAGLQRGYSAEQLSDRVVMLFYRTLTAQDQVSVAQHALERSREIDGAVADRVRAGLSLESDGERAHLQVRAAEDDLATAKDNVDVARTDLFAAMGVPATDQPLEQARSGALPAAPGEKVDLQQRLDIAALDAQTVAAREAQAAAHAAIFPQITTYAHAENDAQKVVASGSGNWTVGAKVTWSVFDGGVRKAREQEAAAQVRAAGAQKRAVLLEAEATQRSLGARLQDMQRRVETAGHAIEVQREALKTARDRYGSGLVTLTDLLNAELDLERAELAQVTTRYQLLTTSADLALTNGAPISSKAGQQ